MRRACGIAVLEIILGSRSDPELAAKIIPIQQMIQQDSLKNVSDSVRADPNALVPLTWLVAWSIRGLSIANIVAADTQPIPGAVALLKDLLKAGIDAGVIPVGGGSRPFATSSVGRATPKPASRS